MIDVTPGPIAVQLGPLAIPWYGLGYAAAFAVGYRLAQRQAELRGIDPKHVGNAFLAVIVLAIIGGRLYHVIDQWAYYQDRLPQVVLPPYSGLGLFGGVFGGVLAVLLYTRRHRLSLLNGLDVAIPSLFIGQAIARWGNFFNQELYGPPTDLPWGIAIDCAHRVKTATIDYSCEAIGAQVGFHPLFFYESMLNLAGGLLAIWLTSRMLPRLRQGDMLALWAIWYGVVRLLLEPLRGGYNWTITGVPTATLISVIGIVLGVWLLATRDRRRSSAPPEGPAHDEDTRPAAADQPPTAPAPGSA
ncbi:MAG TPA: prolipoprotein diacylglyceryl transferase [Candidatus Limnocylindrales bacterium]|nr:prolipoprotein diacylglyceryl transferase [Candidatus Limnocylindrales bacterium]